MYCQVGLIVDTVDGGRWTVLGGGTTVLVVQRVVGD